MSNNTSNNTVTMNNDSATFDVRVAQITNQDQQVTNLKQLPAIKPLGPTYLAEGEFFVIDKTKVYEDMKMRQTEKDKDGNEKITVQVYYAVVKIVDKDGKFLNQAKKLYLNSLCKTVFECQKDPTTGVVKTTGNFVKTEGNVAEIVQNASDFDEALDKLHGHIIQVTEITKVSARKFGDNTALTTASVMTLNTAD